MIPISDSTVSRRRFPFVNLILLATTIAVFFYQAGLGEAAMEITFLRFGVVPVELTTGRDLPPTSDLPLWSTLLTSMFLHGGWLHLGGNMLYLFIFGDNVEDRLGHVTYLAFYLVCGVVAALTQVAIDTQSRVPMVGASGAIAGVLAAYLLFFPNARVTALLVFGFFARIIPVPAILLVGLWALLQFFSGVASLGTTAAGGVAYWAHIGGFAAGLVLALLLRPRVRRRAPARYQPWPS